MRRFAKVVPVIESEQDRQKALVALEKGILHDAPTAYLDTLALVIENYERQAFPIPSADPVAAILFQMNRFNITRTELANRIGVQRGRVSEILNRKRSLSLNMIHAISEQLDIPVVLLIGQRDSRADRMSKPTHE